MSSLQPVWRNEGIFEAIVCTCRLTVVWSAVNHHELLPRSSFSRSPEVYLDFSSSSEGEIILGTVGAAAWSFKARSSLGEKNTTLCKHWPSIKPLKLEFITNATVAHRVNKQLSLRHNGTRWTDKLSVCLQPVQPIKWGQTGTFLLGSWMPNASLAPSVSHITLILLPGKNFQFYLYPLYIRKRKKVFLFCLKRQLYYRGKILWWFPWFIEQKIESNQWYWLRKVEKSLEI